MDNDTRWNSKYMMIQRACRLRAPLRRLYEVQMGKWRGEGCPEKTKPAVAGKFPTDHDWDYLQHLVALLMEFESATERLEGISKALPNVNPLWSSLSTTEHLLQHLETGIQSVPCEDYKHLKTMIQLGWEKLKDYYRKMDDTPAYAAAFIFHPQYGWKTLKKAWKDQPRWISAAEATVEKLWSTEYKPNGNDTRFNTSEHGTSAPPKRRRVEYEGYLSYMKGLESDEDPESEEQDEYAQWRASWTASSQHPVSYWRGNAERWPNLTRMALDLLATPAMSADTERAFSTTNRMISPLRHNLDAAIIGKAQLIRSWRQEGLLD
jgi:hypothetical protein